MFVIKNNTQNEIEINKSRFICLLIKIDTNSNITNLINNIKNKYNDATHYCYSYIIGNKKRFNDDGEPSGTAGLPILNVLENNKLNNILCVVVRYFGGIKLGAGGLVRAYTKAVTNALDKTNLCKLLPGKVITIEFDYNKSKIIDSTLKNINIIIKKFEKNVIYTFEISNNDYFKIKDILNNNSFNIIVEDKEIEEN